MADEQLFEGPYPDCDGKMVGRYDDVVLTKPVLLKMSTGETESASAGCQATILFFVEGNGGEVNAELEVYLPDQRFGFANHAVNRMRFHKSAHDKLGDAKI